MLKTPAGRLLKKVGTGSSKWRLGNGQAKLGRNRWSATQGESTFISRRGATSATAKPSNSALTASPSFYSSYTTWALPQKYNARHNAAKSNNHIGATVSQRNYSTITTDAPAKVYKYEDIKKLIETDHPEVVLIDAREPAEFELGAIPSAINIPVKSSPGALGLDPESFQDAFGFDKPDTEKELVFYCLGGVRSSVAEGLAATFGYQKRGNYLGK